MFLFLLKKTNKFSIMKVQELYDYITKHMTAEQALMKLLEGSLHEYQILKFSEDGKEIHPVMLIVMAAQEMGWDMAITNNDDNQEVELDGMIIGTSDYIDNVLNIDKQENNCQCDASYGDTCCKSE